jgi:hypothetical protein
MADEKSIKLSEEAQQILKDLEQLPEAMPKAIAQAMYDEDDLTVSHIQKEYLSFPKDGPTVEIGLRTRTNRLRQSLWHSTAVEGERVTSSIGDNVTSKGVNYAAVHEFGAHVMIGERKGTVRLRTNARGELLRQPGRRGAIFARAEHKRFVTREFTAGAHEYDIPARAPIQRGIEDRMAEYGAAVSAAVVEAMGGET